MKVQVKFPLPGRDEGSPDGARQNHKAIREQLLLDTADSGVERALLAAADAAKAPGQETFVTRSYGRKGRLAIWIVDSRETDRKRSRSGEHQKSSTGTRRDRSKALKEALARVTL